MCTFYESESKCLHYDSFQDWCPECVEDWFEIIGEDRPLIYNEDEDDR